jgi:midasin
MKCVPDDGDSQNLRVVVSTNNILHKRNPIYVKINTKVEDLLTNLTRDCNTLASHESNFVTEVNVLITVFQRNIEKLHDLRELFVVDNEYSTFGSPICDLYDYMNERFVQIKSYQDEHVPLPSSLETETEALSHAVLLAIQNIYKEHRGPAETEENNSLEENHLKERLHKRLTSDIGMLQLKEINGALRKILDSVFISTDAQNVELLSRIQPLIQQYKLLVDYFVYQQICAHKSSVKMLSIMLSVFLELAKNGFCVPEHLLSDEEQKQEGDTKTGEGFGFEDGEGEKDVSDKLESEDQLDEAKRPEDYNKGEQEEKECKEEKGIDMSENFEGKMHDVDENGSDSDDPNDDKDEEMDKEMGETKDGADKLDDQIWGDDENEKAENEEEQNDESGK